VSRGVDTQSESDSFTFQHSTVSSPQYGTVWAIHRTTGVKDIEVFWRRKSVLNIEWPYELHRYQAVWPTSVSRYQIYVRATDTTAESDVIIPTGPRTATPIPFQDPAGHAGWTANNAFHTTTAGMSLLHLRQTNSTFTLDVFQVVRSVDHRDGLFNLNPTAWEIGKEITDLYHQGAYPERSRGYIHRPEGNRYDIEIYDGQTTHPPAWNAAWTTKQIIPVNTGTLEVWWWNLNSNTAPAIQWPSLVKRYSAGWTNVTQEIVIASQQSWNIPPTYQNPMLYYQNDSSQRGFNPNDEHAWTPGQALYAARSDLGTNTTSLPYVLLKHQQASNQWAFDVIRVVAESPGTNFVYSGGKVGGGDIGSPVPISVLKGQNWLNVGQTLLPNTLQPGSAALLSSSVDILYQQSLRRNQGFSVTLFAPKLSAVVENMNLPSGITDAEGTAQVFPTLPSSLRTRLTYNPGTRRLTLVGEQFDSDAEPMVLPNILSLRDIEWLRNASQNASYQTAIDSLVTSAVPQVLGNDRPYDTGDIALETSTGTGVGYVTLALNNSTNELMLSIGEQENTLPTLQVVRVMPVLHPGAIKTVKHLTDSPVSDKLTLRFNGELGGRPDDYAFKWEFSKNGKDDWYPFTVLSRAGAPAAEPAGRGAVEITVQGPGPATLSDNYFRCFYQRLTPHSVIETNTWSTGTPSAFAEGWIKRALRGLNMFDPWYWDLRNGVDLRSPIARAGKLWNGQVPFNREAVEKAGLIELYETIFRYGINLSLDGTPPLAYDPAGNYDIYQALILAASRLSDLYLLMGNEAYADASDPTIGIGSDFNRAASAMFCFEGQADIPNLLTEELCLLRGRTPGSAATGTTNAPIFNRLYPNFTGGIGDVAM
jgi:hypothetical protein